MKQIAVLFLIVIFAACNGDSGTSYDFSYGNSGMKDSVFKRKKDTSLYKGMSYEDMKYSGDLDKNADLKIVLIERTLKHKFSDPFSLDVFNLKVVGEKIYNSTIDFKITRSTGEEIFHENFPISQVLDKAFEGGGAYATDIQKEDYVKSWMFETLNNTNFSHPAIAPGREFNPDFSDKATWDEIKSDTNAISFRYSSKTEGVTEMAYSRSKSAVIKFYNQ